MAKNAVLLTSKQFRSTGNSMDNLMLLPSTFAPTCKKNLVDHQLNWDGFNLESENETNWLYNPKVSVGLLTTKGDFAMVYRNLLGLWCTSKNL